MTTKNSTQPATQRKPKPLAVGDKKASLLLLNRTYKGRKDWWECLCDCGNRKDIRGDSIRTGHAKTCGCNQHQTVGRRNQKSGFVPKGKTRFVIEAYEGSHSRPASNQLIYSVGFTASSRAGAKPGEYHLGTCTARNVIKGQNNVLWLNGLSVLRNAGLIGPQGGMTVPQWSEKYGVAYRPTLRSGESHIRSEYDRLQLEQKFYFNGQWLDYGDGK